MIAIKSSHNHDEIKMHENGKSEIKFEDHPGVVVQWKLK